MGSLRRIATRTRRPSYTFLQLLFIVVIILFNFLFILWFTAAPALRVLWSGGSQVVVQPSLWDTKQTEPECAEGKTRLLSTDWILKLIAKASTMLRKYRRRNLLRMENGVSAISSEEAEIFDEIGEVMSMLNVPRQQNLDLLSMLPRVLSLYGKLKRSGMFADDGFVDKKVLNDTVSAPSNQNILRSPLSNPLASLEMLNSMMLLLPKENNF